MPVEKRPAICEAVFSPSLMCLALIESGASTTARPGPKSWLDGEVIISNKAAVRRLGGLCGRASTAPSGTLSHIPKIPHRLWLPANFPGKLFQQQSHFPIEIVELCTSLMYILPSLWLGNVED